MLLDDHAKNRCSYTPENQRRGSRWKETHLKALDVQHLPYFSRGSVNPSSTSTIRSPRLSLSRVLQKAPQEPIDFHHRAHLFTCILGLDRHPSTHVFILFSSFFDLLWEFFMCFSCVLKSQAPCPSSAAHVDSRSVQAACIAARYSPSRQAARALRLKNPTENHRKQTKDIKKKTKNMQNN